VVVAHGGEPLLYTALAVPRRAPLIYYRIGGLAEKVQGRARRWLYRALVRRADVVAGVSDETLVDARVILGAEQSKLRLIPNGRDPERFAAKTAPSGEPARLLWIGHLAPGKGAEFFVLVVRALRLRGFDVSASLAGDGPLAAMLKERAEEVGVRMLGRRDDVAELMDASDIVCFTSTGVEGLPGVLIEAGLSGRPVVSTDVAGSRTVVEDGVTGFVVERDDPAAFVDAVQRLIEDVALRERLGAAARERCEQHFTLEVSADHWRALLDGVLQS
jgi:glycosyltransferase involved in cell wall biosynthesis